MMYSRNAAQRYQTVTSAGQVAGASPTRLVQIIYEHILTNLATAQGCMGRINGNLPYNEVVVKCKAMSKAIRLISQLDGTLDMDKGGDISKNLHNLYLYVMERLTVANINNDPEIVAECTRLLRTIKTGWDGIVRDDR